MHDLARKKLLGLAERHAAAVLELDTKWPASRNKNRIRNPDQFESLCARVDVLLTTRLHGMVLALKNGVPAIAIDAIRGGGKVLQQARAVGWSEAFPVESVSDEELSAALDRCLAPEARARALSCANAARETLATLGAEFATALGAAPGKRDLPSSGHLRLKRSWTLLRERMKRRRASHP
jgi:polysaccharide pyruvyl transferase WcaK-like protein